MAIPTPAPGLVISYAYLWSSQSAQGQIEGSKYRPCAIVLAVKDQEGDTLVYVAPITHSEPSDPHAVEIPISVKRRLGLDPSRSWIVTSDLNRFIWPGYDLRPISRSQTDVFDWGFLPVEILAALKRSIALHQKAGRIRITSRD